MRKLTDDEKAKLKVIKDRKKYHGWTAWDTTAGVYRELAQEIDLAEYTEDELRDVMDQLHSNNPDHRPYAEEYVRALRQLREPQPEPTEPDRPTGASALALLPKLRGLPESMKDHLKAEIRTPEFFAKLPVSEGAERGTVAHARFLRMLDGYQTIVRWAACLALKRKLNSGAWAEETIEAARELEKEGVK